MRVPRPHVPMPLNPCLRFGAILVLATALSAQVNWSSLAFRSGHGLASDFASVAMVVYGGEGRGGALLDDTWVYSNTNAWSQRFPDTVPPPLQGHSLGYWTDNLARKHVLLFGGIAAGPVPGRSAATWIWTGDNWVLNPPAALMPPRDGHALAFDGGRQRVVLFGGLGIAGSPLRDTWEWDGTTWNQRTPTTSPPARYDHEMAYDPSSDRIIMFGGNGPNQETWEFNSLANMWTQHATAPANTPSRRTGHAMAYDVDSGRIVLFGGRSSNGIENDTWVWEPNLQPAPGWVQQSPTTSPSGRTKHRLEFNSAASGRGLVLIGGEDAAGQLQPDVWRWSASSATWTPHFPPPPPRLSSPLAYDIARDAVVMFGGSLGTGVQYSLGDTWEMHGDRWLQISPSASPPPRLDHGLVYMPARGRTILFGGSSPGPNGGPRNDTWDWDGTSWRQLSPPNAPSPRSGFVMAYDSVRQRIVLFAGDTCGNSCYTNETWEFDGSTWAHIPTTNRPSPRAWTCMAFHESRRRMVLFSGVNAPGGDTWEYDGVDWVQANPANSPVGGSDMLAYDRSRKRSVLFQGGVRESTWEWDGTTWMQRFTTVSPPTRGWAGMVYDDKRARVVMFGGAPDWQSEMNDTWILAVTHPSAADRFGRGCTGSHRLVPSLDPAGDSRPWAGDTFQVEGTSLLPSGASFLFLGFNRDAWNGIGLGYPNGFPLDVLGMPGCLLHAGGEVMLPFLHSAGGTGGAAIAIPLNESLAGLRFYLQLLSFDVGANPFGATTSNGLNCRIGAK